MSIAKVDAITDRAGTGPTTATFGIKSILGYYYGYFDTTGTWARTSATMGDGTNSGGSNLIALQSVNMGTVSAATSSVLGILLTPPSVTAAYFVQCVFGVKNSNAGGYEMNFRLYDGTNTVGINGFTSSSVRISPASISGIWVPGTTSPSTIKIQIASESPETTTIQGVSTGGANAASWTIIKLNP
jgi:hypothetical protein